MEIQENRVWVTDEIGDEYKKWGPYDNIFINAPTGSGKSTFIIETFLPYMAEEGKKILYLVNRRILQKQIKEELKEKYAGDTKIEICIRVETYQALENSFKTDSMSNNPKSALMKLENFDVVVCDEVHYFLTDSNFNTNTCISFRMIMNIFRRKISVFMSATIEDFRNYVREYVKDDPWSCTPIYRYVLPIKENFMEYATHARNINGMDNEFLGRVSMRRNYEIIRNYDFLDIDPLQDKNKIAEKIQDKNSKWLIFVDNIEYGKQLRQDLKKSLGKKEEIGDTEKEENEDSDIVLVTAEYEKDRSANEEVDRISQKKKFSARILISTAVMDNGITISDIKLRNLVVFADTETEFVQMLGRKRDDSERVKLYILQRSKDYFVRKLRLLSYRQRMAVDYMKRFEDMIGNPLSLVKNQIDNDDRNGTDEAINHDSWIENLLYFMCTIDEAGKFIKYFGGTPVFSDQIKIWSNIAYVVELIRTQKEPAINIEKLKEEVADLSEDNKVCLCNNTEDIFTKLQRKLNFQTEEERQSYLEQAAKIIIIIQEKVLTLNFQEKEKVIRGYFYNKEYTICDQQHKKILQDIFDHKIKSEDAMALFFAYDGKLYINQLSVKNLEILEKYYKSVIEQFEREGDGYTFLRRQLSWLGKRPEEIEQIIKDSMETEEEKLRKIIMKKIESKVNVKMSKEAHFKFREEFRKELRRLVELVATEDIKTKNSVMNELKGNDRSISANHMKYISAHCNLPYKLEIKREPGKRTYTYTFLHIES